MPIELKGLNYCSKVFKRINYRLSNSTFWVVITELPPVIIELPFAPTKPKILWSSTCILFAKISALLQFFKQRNCCTTAHHRHHQIEHWMQEGESYCAVCKFWEKGMSTSDSGQMEVSVLHNPPEHQIMSWPLPSMQIPNLLLPLGIKRFIFSLRLVKFAPL